MFSKIVVALNDPPESQRALRAAIDLPRSCGDGFHPRRSPRLQFVFSRCRSMHPAAMMEERGRRHQRLHEKAANLARELGVHAQSSVLVDKEVRSILRFLQQQNAYLLVVGLHQHDFYLSHAATPADALSWAYARAKIVRNYLGVRFPFETKNVG